MSTVAIAKAQADEVAARQRFDATLDEVRSRIAPKALARDVGERGLVIADRNAASIVAVTIAVTIYLARHRIAAVFKPKRRHRKGLYS